MLRHRICADSKRFLFRVDVVSPSDLPRLDDRYNVFVGGLPADASVVPGSLPTSGPAPFIGCVRDVLVSGTALADFNAVPYLTPGIEPGVCKSVMPAEPDQDVEEEDGGADGDADGESSTEGKKKYPLTLRRNKMEQVPSPPH